MQKQGRGSGTVVARSLCMRKVPSSNLGFSIPCVSPLAICFLVLQHSLSHPSPPLRPPSPVPSTVTSPRAHPTLRISLVRQHTSGSGSVRTGSCGRWALCRLSEASGAHGVLDVSAGWLLSERGGALPFCQFFRYLAPKLHFAGRWSLNADAQELRVRRWLSQCSA